MFSWNTAQGKGPLLQRLLRKRALAIAIVVVSTTLIAILVWWLVTRLPEPRLITTLPWNGTPVDQVLYSPDGRWIATSGDGSVKLWDGSTLLATHSLRVPSMASHVHVAFTPDSKVMAAASYQDLQLWDVAKGTKLRSIPAHDDFVTALTTFADGTRLVSAGHDGLIKIWELPSGTLKEVIPGAEARTDDDSVKAISISPNGRLLAWIGRNLHTVRLWDIDTHKELPSLHLDFPTRMETLAFSTDGHSLATGHSGGLAFTLWDVRTGELLQSASTRSGNINAIAFSPDGQVLVVGCGGPSFIFDEPGRIELWDPRAGKLKSRWKAHESWVTSLAFSPDGKTLVSGGHDGTINLWDLANCTKEDRH